MMKTIAVFLRHGSRWNADKPVREQAYWDEHARFMDSLFDAGQVILMAESAEAARAIFQEDPWARQDILVANDAKEWTIFLDARDKPQGSTRVGVRP